MALKFASLHNHTGYSIYDGLGSVEDHVKWMLKNAGDDSGALAITDHGHMNAAGYIAEAQKKYGDAVKLIYGFEAYFLPSLDEWQKLKIQTDEDKKEEKEKKKSEEVDTSVIENEAESKENKYFNPLYRRNHLVVCAYNNKGLENLFTLVSRSYRQGMYKKPRIDLKMLREFNEGLIVSSACLGGVASHASFYARENNLDVMSVYEKEISPFQEIFGPDRYFLELQFNKIPQQQIVNKDIIEYSKKSGIKMIATADAHFSSPDLWKDRELYRLLGWQLQKNDVGDKVKELNAKELKDMDCQLYLKNGDQMFEAYKEEFKKHHDDDDLIKEAIERSYDIAHNLVEKNIKPDNTIKLPKIKFADNKTPYEHLKDLCLAGLKKKKLSSKEYIDRAAYELKVIKQLDMAEYFLTTKEILDVLRKHMLLGCGRGSAGGSLICYLLDIVLVDPIEHGLLFERFISPSRKDIADIDNDVELKEESLDILKHHFGFDNVVAISNYNRLQLKSLVKDISRLYDIPFEEVNHLTKNLEIEAKDKLLEEVGHDQKLYQLTFEGAKKYSPTFQKFLEKYPQVGDHIAVLYQEVKSTGLHAGGIAILQNIEKYLPIVKIRDTDQSPVSEGLTAQHLQKYFGIPKIDILGLTTLKMIRRCIELILVNQGNKHPTIEDVWEFYNKNLHPSVIPQDDKKVFEKVYHKGNFVGIFQFTEHGVQRFVKKAKPNNVGDISVCTALFRPGALSSKGDEKYLEFFTKKAQKKFSSEHPILQEILKPTRATLVFQEQFQLLAHRLANFTLEEANDLRKLLVKPATSLGEEMKQQRIIAGEKFIAGCVSNGMTQQRAEDLWHKEIMGYISYGFNKSHSQNYAFNSYHCAWLFTHYEKEWITACLEKDEKLEEMLASVRKAGYTIRKPDILLSTMNTWNISDKKECIPAIMAIKGVGLMAATDLFTHRPKTDNPTLQEFFFDGSTYRYGKFNKTCLTALMRTEGFISLNCVGDDKIFKNYAHMERTFFGETIKWKINKHITYSNFNLIRDGRSTIEELAAEANADDWTTSEKIQHQKELLGFYDKSLVIGDAEQVLAEYNVSPIDQVADDEDKNNVWVLVDKVSEKKTKKGSTFLIVSATGLSEKTYSFRVWNASTATTKIWKEGNLLVLSLEYEKLYGYSVGRNSDILVIKE